MKQHVASTAERRLAGYGSYLGRYFGALRDKYDLSDPIQWPAAATHLVTGAFGIDPALRDAARMFHGDTSEVPPYEGAIPRIKEDTVGAIGKAMDGKIVLGIVEALNIVGDSISDAMDRVTGVTTQAHATRSQMHSALNTREIPYGSAA